LRSTEPQIQQNKTSTIVRAGEGWRGASVGIGDGIKLESAGRAYLTIVRTAVPARLQCHATA